MASWGVPNGGLGSPHAAASPVMKMPDYTDLNLLGSIDTAMLYALSLKQASDMSGYSSLLDSQLQHMPSSSLFYRFFKVHYHLDFT
jgi:hypothetical protein